MADDDRMCLRRRQRHLTCGAMLLNLKCVLITPIQLIDEPLHFDEAIAPGTLEFAADLRQVGPMPVAGQAELIVEHRGSHDHVNDIRLRADYHGDFEVLCARCVEPVPLPVAGDFDLIFRRRAPMPVWGARNYDG